MKLTDILREIEGEEDGMNQLKVNYDLAVQPTDLDAALTALNDTKNMVSMHKTCVIQKLL
jgi:hypothetical protein